MLEGLQQEESLEAIEDAELQQALGESLQSVTDPMQKLVLLQMQQMSLLSKQLKPKTQDPLQLALGGDSSTSSTSGIKGCLAREAYTKVVSDLVKVAGVVEGNALAELGLSATDVTPGLLREYVERRIPLGDYKLLTQMAYLMASAWEVGHRSGNRELQGFAGKAMMFIEQTSIDSGRTGLSWLLTGLNEPIGSSRG